jgi:predicted nucleic acid-binding protein
MAGAAPARALPRATPPVGIAASARQPGPLGLTDASIVVQAARHKTTRILSLDHRHFAAVRPLTSDDSFTLLPRDDQA